MNFYTDELSLFDFAPSDPVFGTLTRTASVTSAAEDHYAIDNSPPRHRHDGASPLPLGLDWSPPPLKWDGPQSVWPHDPHTGWRYCVTIPSWVVLPKSRGSDPVVFYRVQVGIQSPEGVTTTRAILRRFNDFLKLFNELKKEFPRKNLPAAPPKRLLRFKTRTNFEERRHSLDDWMEKLLSDIDISRSVQVATFLELEAAARSSFSHESQHILETSSSASGLAMPYQFQANPDSSSVASDYGDDTFYENSERDDDSSEAGLDNLMAETTNYDIAVENKIERLSRLKMHTERLSAESIGSDLSSVRGSEISNFGVPTSIDEISNLQFRSDLVVALPSDERHKMNRVLDTMRQRLATAKTDMEDLIARLNQELAVRQYLTTKVKDLEVELETTKQNCKESLQQAILSERERFTQMQWDTEEFRRKCFEMELKLKSEQDERLKVESTNESVVQENDMLLQELDDVREQLENMKKRHEEIEAKSKADLKVLVKEVKSLRISQSDLKQDLSRLMKEKIEVERILQKEKQRREEANTANAKLLHECGILRDRLEECSVTFAIDEEEDRLTMDASSPSDAIDMLTTSDNRIGLLLAEAQLLAQDVENALGSSDRNSENINVTVTRTTDDEVRRMLTDILVDNARLRKQMNSVIGCALNKHSKSEEDDEEEEEENEEEEVVPIRKTVLSRLLER